ncbi:MAG: hypothetical protein ABI537_15780 [Casimicrobiaceae bacterium]
MNIYRDSLELLTRRDLLRFGILLVVLLVLALWGLWRFLESATPRHIVLASGTADGMYHRYALRYKEILARDGVVIDERMTAGAGDNLRLLLDPASGVDVGFVQGGVGPTGPSPVEMIAALYYEPMWIFYRSSAPMPLINAFLYKRVAIGAAGSGARIRQTAAGGQRHHAF